MTFPSQQSTPSENTVVAVLTSTVSIALGIVALVVAIRAPEEQHELAATVMRGGFLSLGIGLTIAVMFWLYRRLSS